MAMNITDAGFISAAGMRAQGDRIKVISQNVSNMDSLGVKPGADPYRRQMITFKETMDRDLNIKTVQANKVIKDMTDFELKYMPGHPAANQDGFVKMPNVNMSFEMADMREAQRSYEANLGMLEMSRNLMGKLVDLLRA